MGSISDVYEKFGREKETPMGSKTHELEMKKVRGAMLKWSKEVDLIEVHEVNGEELTDSWMDWMEDKLPGFPRLLEDEDGSYVDKYERYEFEDLKSQMEILYNDKDEFRENVMEKVEVVEEEEDEEEEEQGSQDSDQGEEEEEDEGYPDYDGPFENLVEIGIFEPGIGANDKAIRGAMMNFVKTVDAVEGTEMNPNHDEAKEAFNRWMMDKFGNEWVNFLSYHLPPGKLRNLSEEMWENVDDYKETVKRKWDYAPGNSKEDGETTTDEEVDETPSGIGGWAEKEGVAEEEEEDEERGSKGHNRGRFIKWSKVSAPREDKYELEDFRNEILRGNVWTQLDKLPANSVDMVGTSPPYWNLRDYEGEEYEPIGGDPDCDHAFNKGRCIHCEAWKGQLGREPDPQMFVNNIVAIMQKVSRVLKPTGSLWLNIGDNYASESFRGDIRVQPKSMMMIPERIFIKLMDLGWIQRNKVVWAKQVLMQDNDVVGATNPTSVKDRINYAHEPVHWFTQNRDYYSDIFSVRREPKTDPQDMSSYSGKYNEEEIDDEMYNSPTARAAREGYEPSLYHEAGANIPDVWQNKTGSAGKEHPAVYDPTLMERPIKATCPKWVCDRCGQPFIRQVEEGEHQGWERSCTHTNAGKRPGIVLDPFGGRGSTAKMAEDLGREWTLIEVSDKYADFAEEFVTGASQMKLTDMGD